MAKPAAQNKKEELKEIWVHRSKPNLVTLALAEDLNLRIFPGNTRISNQEILQALATPKVNHGWLSLLESGAIKIINSNKEDSSEDQTSIKPFTSMSASKAIKLIQGLYSIPELEQMMSEEQSKSCRDSVLQAIKDQIKQLKDSDGSSIGGESEDEDVFDVE